MKGRSLLFTLFISLILTTTTGLLTAYAECQSYQDKVFGNTSGYYLLSCQICTSDYDQFNFDCNLTYYNYSDDPGMYMSGTLKVYATYIDSSQYLNITFSSHGEDPIQVFVQGQIYQVFFDNIFVETVNGAVTQAGGYLIIDGISYPFTPDLLGVVF